MAWGEKTRYQFAIREPAVSLGKIKVIGGCPRLARARSLIRLLNMDFSHF